MSILTFNLKEVVKLSEEIKNSDSFSLTSEELYDPFFWKDGRILNKQGLTESECPDEFFSPDPNRVDKSKITPNFVLVKDQGIYLMGNNTKAKGEDENKKVSVVYANGYNPEMDEDWWEKGRLALGGDDTCISLPIQWLNHAIEKKCTSFCIEISATSIGLAL